MKKLIPFFLIFVILTLNAIAVPPFLSQSVGNIHTLNIEVSLQDYYLQNSNFNISFHVFNSTGHQVNNDTANCLIHIFKPFTGEHIDTNTVFNSPNDFTAILNSSHSGIKTHYSFIFQCNTTYEGGYISGQYEINNLNRELTNNDNTAGISIIIFILFATGLIFILPSMIKKFTENQIVDLLLKRCFYIIGFYLMVMNSALIHSIATTSGYLTGEINMYLYLFGIGGYLLMIATFLKTFYDVVLTYNKMIKERRGLE